MPCRGLYGTVSLSPSSPFRPRPYPHTHQPIAVYIHVTITATQPLSSPLAHLVISFVPGNAETPAAHDYRDNVAARATSTSPLSAHDYRMTSDTSQDQDGTARPRLPSEGGNPHDYRGQINDYRIKAIDMPQLHTQYETLESQRSSAANSLHLYEVAPDSGAVTSQPASHLAQTRPVTSSPQTKGKATRQIQQWTAPDAHRQDRGEGYLDIEYQGLPAITPLASGEVNYEVPVAQNHEYEGVAGLEDYETPMTENPDYRPPLAAQAEHVPGSPIYDAIDEERLQAASGRRTSSYKQATLSELDGNQGMPTTRPMSGEVIYDARTVLTAVDAEEATQVVLRAGRGRSNIPTKHVYSQVNRGPPLAHAVGMADASIDEAASAPNAKAAVDVQAHLPYDQFNPFNDDSTVAQQDTNEHTYVKA